METCFYSSRILSLKFLYYSIPFKYKLLPIGLPDRDKLDGLKKSEIILKILDKLTFGSNFIFKIILSGFKLLDQTRPPNK
jgi:hypothetical protein